MPILSSKGVEKDMQFKCIDCNVIITGQEVIDGEYLHIVTPNKMEPLKSQFRCKCCQDDLDERDNY